MFLQAIFIIDFLYTGKILGKHDVYMSSGLELGKFQLENMFLCITMGMNGSLVTLVTHARGANMPTLCGVYLNRAILINALMFVPLSMLMMYGGPYINYLLHPDKAIFHNAEADFSMLVNLPAIYFLSMFDLLRRYLSCFKATWVPLQLIIGATGLHLLWCNLLVDRLGWGIAGIDIAFTMTSLTLFASIVIYALRVPEVYDVLFWPELTVWSGWIEYSNLAFSSAIIYSAHYIVLYLLIIVIG